MSNSHIQSLITLDEERSYASRWNGYLGPLVKNNNLKIVIGDKDYVLCANTAPCNLAMHIVTLDWVKTLTQNSVTSFTAIPNIVDVLPGVDHDVWPSLDINFIVN